MPLGKVGHISSPPMDLINRRAFKKGTEPGEKGGGMILNMGPMRNGPSGTDKC